MYTLTNGDGPEFEQDDEVIVIAGVFEGEVGTIAGYDEAADVYFVKPYNTGEWGADAVFAVLPSMIEMTDDEDEDEDELPDLPAMGMTSEQTAEHIGEFVEFCQSRVLGTGQDQYEQDGIQQFEHMSLEDLIEYSLEELADNVNYSVFMAIRLRRIQAALRAHL